MLIPCVYVPSEQTKQVTCHSLGMQHTNLDVGVMFELCFRLCKCPVWQVVLVEGQLSNFALLCDLLK